MTTKQICALFGYSRQYLHVLARQRGVEPFVYIGGAALWSVDDLPRLRPVSKTTRRKKRRGRPRRDEHA